MMRLGKVVAVHPEDHSCDVIMLDDASRYAGVQVMAGMAGLDCGISALVEPELADAKDKWSLKDTGSRDVLAVVGMLRQQPIILGFLHQQVTQMLFARKNFHVRRHPSDVYATTDDEGNLEVAHPSGTFVRIAVNPEHEDLTGKDFDKRWKIKRNKAKAVSVRIEVQNAGARKSTWTMKPDGTVTLDATSDVLIKTPSKVTVDCPDSLFTGKVTVNGLLTYKAGVAGTSGANGSKISGSLEISGGNVTADGIGLKTHGHIEQGDGARVSPPVA